MKTLWIVIVLIALQTTAIAADTEKWQTVRKQRIDELLPQAMQRAGVDGWIILCREDNNDPLASHVGCENAGGQAAVLFYLDKSTFHSVIFSPVGEAQALKDKGLFGNVIDVARGESSLISLASHLQRRPLKTIAVNSGHEALADGLSYTQRIDLESALKDHDFKGELVSSQELVYQWLSVKLPQEVAYLREAAKMTSDWQYEVYQRIEPGKTTDAEVAGWLKDKMRQAGVTDGWSPEQNPNVNSGPDRGHSHATNKVIMPGDVIQIDFGIKLYDMWVSDIQRFAYVLKPGESAAPEHIQHHWDIAIKGNRAVLNAMKPGVSGVEVDKAQRDIMQDNGSLPVMWSSGHPVGYVAHDIGPSLSGGHSEHPRASALKTLQQGMVFAFDGFYKWQRSDGSMKTFSVEEMAVVTESGAEYLVEPQRELVLIRANR